MYAGTEGEERPSGLSEGMWRRIQKMVFAPSVPAQPLTDGIRLPNPGDLAEAVTWARAHEVSNKDALAWTRTGTQPTVDLRLAQSLPVVSELLVTNDVPMARTALIALQLNGAEVETDAEWESPSTRFDVKFPDGTEKTVEFTQ
jgi:hypothetical protein